MAKRVAEGPFVLTKRLKGEIVRTVFSPTGSWATFYGPGLLPEQVNMFLADWLKTKQGAEWMKSNGIGGGK